MDYRENDRILRLLTIEHGKVSAMARGIRKETSSLRGAVEPITLGIYHLNPGRNMFTISQAEILQNFSRIKESLKAIVAASFLVDLTDSFLEEHNPDSESYELLKKSLLFMDKNTSQWLEIAFYLEVNIHKIHGVLPDIYKCISCGSTKAGRRVRIDVNRGGVLCKDCSKELPRDDSYPLESLFIIEKASNLDIDNFINSDFDRDNLSPAFRIIERFTDHYIGKEIKSRNALDLYTVRKPEEKD